jgi:hypothetical protein
MILLKHLAREFDISPARIRKLLRPHFTPTNRRWRWEDEDPQLTAIRQHLSISTSTPHGSRHSAPSQP